MSKIICDVCGTTYPDSSTQCPICGSVRAADNKGFDNNSVYSGSSGKDNYTYVRGGRFSKKNVKKRNKHTAYGAKQPTKNDHYENYNDKRGSGKGLIALIIVLLLAVVAVAAYITIEYFNPIGFLQDLNLFPAETTVQTQDETENTQAQEIDIACTEIKLSVAEVTLESAGAEVKLEVEVAPKDTTDVVTFESEDEKVATVSEDGTITAVGAGETTITVNCGELAQQCKVTCSFAEETTVPETTVPQKTYTEPFALTKTDVTIRIGEKFELSLQDANKEKIEVGYEIVDSTICTMEGTTVTGAAKGRTNIKVTYNDVTYTCIVRVY